MKDAITPGGTSLEVLAPYLPYGVELMELKDGAPVARRWPVLTALYAASKTALLGAHEYPVPLVSLLPVLRPFSQLCQPLEDGTVPAVEVAKLALGNPHFVASGTPALATSGDSFRISFGERKKPYVLIMPGFSVFWVDGDDDVNTPNNYIAIVDYLRSEAFALPVNGRPLVEGVDFIAKSAAATPIQERPAG